MASTKSNAPWSVKGIERDARETAKEAAQKEGMTVGAWLNQMIYSAGAPQTSGGVVEGLKLKDVITAIEALNTRVATAEGKSADALNDLVRNVGNVVERVQRLERSGGGGGNNSALAERLSRLEEKSQDRQRIDTLKALEKAVGQVALQFDTAHKEALLRLESQEKQLQQMATRLEGAESDPQAASAINYLKNAVDGLAARISRAERIASEASKLNQDASGAVDAKFVERTGARLRVLGDEIKRGGDQIQALENSIVKLSSQIDAAEKRSAEGVHKVSETIVQLREQFSTMDAPEAADTSEIEAAVAAVAQRTDERISSLQRSFDDMVARLEQSENEKPAALFNEAPLAAPQVDAELDEALAAFDLDEDDQPDKDAFTVDLDEDDALGAAEQDEGEDILAEVRQAFEEEPSDADNPYGAIGETEEKPADAPTDLDAVLAELEGLGLREDAPKKQDPKKSFLEDVADDEAAHVSPTPDLKDEMDVPSPAEAQAEEKPESIASAADDYLKAARRAARDAAASEEEGKPKPKLTKKQRAILAARIKRKREEAAKAAAGMEEPAPLEAKKPARASLAPDVIDFDQDDDEEDANDGSLAARLSDAFAGLRNRLPGGAKADASEKKSDEVTPDEVADFKDDTEDGDDPNLSGAAKKAFSGVTTKPVTLALGASILLAVIALFFIVKDVFLAPAGDKPDARIAVTQGDRPVPAASQQPASVDNATVAEVPEAPVAAPTVQPRDLYLQGVAALQLAQTPEDEAAAIQQLQESAALGHPPAQLQLGELYKTGQGVDQDQTQARIWFERAAEGGNVLAMHRVGVMTAQGEGGAADLNAAVEYFEQAGNRALVDSQYNLGAIYHPGADGAEGVQDAGQAYYWYSLAAKNGDEQAASLAAGLANIIDAPLKSELDASVEAWAPTPANPVANEVAPAS